MKGFNLRSTSRNSSIILGLVLVMVIIAFHKSFIQMITFTSEKPAVIIIHSLSLIIWTLLLVLQPALIYYKKFALHRKLGNLSKIIVVIFVITTFLAALASYNHLKEMVSFPKGIFYLIIQIMGIGIFTLLYILALRNKKNILTHIQYIVASTTSLLAPAIFRITQRFGLEMMGSTEFACNVVTYSLFNGVFLILCIMHARKGQSYFPYVLTALLLVPIEVPQLYFSLVEPLF